ncbi:hypothetical protein UB34_20865, partial [Photobacterium leiognathi]
VIEVTDVNTNELTFFYHPVSDHTSTTRYIALPSRIDATVFVDLLSNDGMENDGLALDHVASLITVVDDVNALLTAGTSVSFEVLNIDQLSNVRDGEYLAGYNSVFSSLGTLDSVETLQGVIDSVNANIDSQNAIEGYATNNDATNLTIAELEAIFGVTDGVTLVDENLPYYKEAIAGSVATDVDSGAKLVTLLTAVNTQYTSFDMTGALVANRIDGATVQAY